MSAPRTPRGAAQHPTDLALGAVLAFVDRIVRESLAATPPHRP